MYQSVYWCGTREILTSLIDIRNQWDIQMVSFGRSGINISVTYVYGNFESYKYPLISLEMINNKMPPVNKTYHPVVYI